jgi:hypothetical protein
MLFTRIQLLIVTLWVGSLWAVGYIVAPTLFITLTDRVLAGTIAGGLFRVEAWVSVACGVALLILRSACGIEQTDKRTLLLIGTMLACTLIGYFGLQPFMAALREVAGPGGVMASEAKTRFGILHGLSSGVYLMQSLIGAALVLKLAQTQK